MKVLRKTKAVTVAVMAIAAAHMPLLADTRTNDVNGVTWQYTVTDNKVTLGTGAYSQNGRAVIGTPPENLVIPAAIGGMPVVEIGQWAFFGYYTELKSVTISEGVTNILEGAFDSCRAMKRVVIPESVKSIGSRYGWYAFFGCSSLDEVEFLGDMNNIDMDITKVFSRTPWLENQPFSLAIKDGQVTGFIGRCPETILVPDGVSRIGYGVFDINLFPSVTNLVTIVFPESLAYIGYAFNGCERLAAVHIPQNVSSLDNGAFRFCKSLSNVTFGREDYLTYYDMTAFKGTPFFDTLPFSLRLGWRLEEGWDAERMYVIDYIGKCPENLDIAAIHVAQWEADRQRILTESGGYNDIGETPAIRGIAEQVFAGCDIKSVVLPASLLTIENGAFIGCTNMMRIVFTGNTPGEIAEDAFYVWEQGHYDEWWNWVPDYYGANTNCTVYVPANSTGWGVTIPGVWRGMRIAYSTAFNVENGVLVSVVAGEDTELTVPSGATNIAANAFAGCGGLERVTIGDSVTSIDPTAFAGCGKLWAKWFKTLERLSSEDTGSASEVALTVTNVVVHYVTQSVPSASVVPSEMTGIVSVIGEVNAGAALAIPSTWADQYGAAFTAKFGNDFSRAVTARTGKRDGAGNAMFVWQDFVAGTDPTDENDVFTASITFDKDTNEPIISWTPELPAAEAAKRNYKTFGKVRLTDADWTLVDGDASAYNFFKVTVEMK